MARFSVPERSPERKCLETFVNWREQEGLVLLLGTRNAFKLLRRPHLIIGVLLQSGEELPESERPSMRAVAQNGLLATVADSDTTSTTPTAVVYYLLLNPDAYVHIQEEVNSAFPNGEEPLD